MRRLQDDVRSKEIALIAKEEEIEMIKGGKVVPKNPLHLNLEKEN